MLFAIVLAGFARTLFLRPLFDTPINPWYLYWHGGVTTAWYACLIVQTALVSARRVDLHRLMGVVGAGLAVAVVTLGAVTMVNSIGPARMASRALPEPVQMGFMRGVAWVNIQMLVFFTVAVSVALLRRRSPQTHKRLMLLASINLVIPGATRVFDWPIWGLGNNAHWPLVACVAVLAGALAVHDVRSRGSVHRVTLIGGSVMIVSAGLSMMVVPSTAFGRSVVDAIYRMTR